MISHDPRHRGRRYLQCTTMGWFPALLCTLSTSSMTSVMVARLVHTPSGDQLVMWNWVTCCIWVLCVFCADQSQIIIHQGLLHPQIWRTTQHPQIWRTIQHPQIWRPTQHPQIWRTTQHPQIWRTTQHSQIWRTTQHPQIWRPTQHPQIWRTTQHPQIWRTTQRLAIEPSIVKTATGLVSL